MLSVAILIPAGPDSGQIEVSHGRLSELRIAQGRGQCAGSRYTVKSVRPCRIEISLDDTSTAPGANATIVNVRRHLPPDPPDPALRQLRARISQTDYARYWSQYQHEPTPKDHILGIIIRLIPKIGIFKVLAIKAPSPQTEDLFVKSLNSALTRFQELLTELSKCPSSELALANRDLDTGFRVRPGAYELTDRAYAKLLHKVTQKPGLPIPRRLREDVLAYYADPAAPISTKRNGRAWRKVLAQLELLEHQATADSRHGGDVGQPRSR